MAPPSEVALFGAFEGGAKIVPQVELTYAPWRGGAILAPLFFSVRRETIELKSPGFKSCTLRKELWSPLLLQSQTTFAYLQRIIVDNMASCVPFVFAKAGQSGFLTFTDYVGLDTDILITFWSVLGIYTDL